MADGGCGNTDDFAELMERVFAADLLLVGSRSPGTDPPGS